MPPFFSLSLSTLWPERFLQKSSLASPNPAEGDRLMARIRLTVLRNMAGILAMIFSCGLSVAEPDQTSADHLMPACRDAASLLSFSNIRGSKEELSRASFCVGIITGLSYMGQPYGICLPVGTTSQQAARVVVQYIDGQPERVHENFNSLAVEALREAWPCWNLARPNFLF
jgi:hypothetical protein